MRPVTPPALARARRASFGALSCAALALLASCTPDFVETRVPGRPRHVVEAELAAPSSYAGSQTTLKVGLGEANDWELSCPGSLSVHLEDERARKISLREGVALRASLTDPKPGVGGVCPVLEITANVDEIRPESVAAAFAQESELPRVEVRGIRVKDDLTGPDAFIDHRQARLVLGPCRPPEEVERICRRLIESHQVACAAEAGIQSAPSGTLTLTTSHGVEIATWPGPARVRCDGSDSVYLHRGDWHEVRRYRDSVVLTAGANGQVLAINEIGIESYLKGVVPAQIPADAPDQALEAQALIARTQAFAGLTRRRHSNDPYDVCDDVHCQRYRGLGEASATSDAAVDATRGLVLLHDGELVDAAYHADCGGILEANDTIWPKQRPDPVLRARADLEATATTLPDFSAEATLWSYLLTPPETFCSRGTQPGQHRWTRSFSADELARLASGGTNLGKIKALRVDARGASGRATVVTIEGTAGSRRIEGEQAIRKALGDLPSSAFAVQAIAMAGTEPAVFTLVGAGAGHGVGLCQAGAIGMARTKASMTDILAHYYPGAHAYRITP